MPPCDPLIPIAARRILKMAISPTLPVSSHGFQSSVASKLPEVFIVAAGRTPVGSMSGSLKALTATELGAQVVKATIDRAG
ncbi:hypothetical protein Pst134EA_032241 [Puccinia striiformis f. sp. tritici]|uniref:uncharacterized protein n=1 Tax=Puccinia striiformis f. sp. tritici TaxID=168172 RepID=UPI00200824C5|nr:uncharacterized protein Pst134EA_032241 [Puccinia striiformis f. sp. tritici]KAH9444335.1 hypothetical protein Pst134EA_032241 [Puccinia striiformis f. sp. tritici]